jgi:hypothetical protein
VIDSPALTSSATTLRLAALPQSSLRRTLVPVCASAPPPTGSTTLPSTPGHGYLFTRIRRPSNIMRDRCAKLLFRRPFPGPTPELS